MSAPVAEEQRRTIAFFIAGLALGIILTVLLSIAMGGGY